VCTELFLARVYLRVGSEICAVHLRSYAKPTPSSCDSCSRMHVAMVKLHRKATITLVQHSQTLCNCTVINTFSLVNH
jgi:hypothetical protein